MVELTLLNPWWKGKEYIRDDKHIKELEEKEYRWEPELLSTLRLVPDNIFTLRGPRQVGKTTLMKLLIQKLLQRPINEKAVFFWNCDELVDFRELSSLLREYLELCKIHNVRVKYIFLDEISKVKDWQRAIKSLKDSGELDHCMLMLTGSNTLDIKYGSEKLPGRTGRIGEDLLLLPVSFSEYVKLINPSLASKIKKIEQLSTKEVYAKAEAARAFSSELKTLFGQYLITGGFPLVINEFLFHKKIPDYVYELYFRWIAGDIAKWGKQEKILIQLMSAVIDKQTTPISWDSLAKESEIKSHKTVSAYIEDLENMFALLVLYFLTLDTKMADYNKNKKIYFFDPFIFHVFNKKIAFKEGEIQPSLIETAVVSNLSRRTYDGLLPSIYYWKNKKEVDAVVKIKNEIFPFEVKYQTRISKQDFKGLHYFNKGILITKDTFMKGEKYSAIPVHLLLAIL